MDEWPYPFDLLQGVAGRQSGRDQIGGGHGWRPPNPHAAMDVDFSAARNLVAGEPSAARQVGDRRRRIVNCREVQVPLTGDARGDITEALFAHVDNGADAMILHSLESAGIVLSAEKKLRRHFAQIPERRAGQFPPGLIGETEQNRQGTGLRQAHDSCEWMRGLGWGFHGWHCIIYALTF